MLCIPAPETAWLSIASTPIEDPVPNDFIVPLFTTSIVLVPVVGAVVPK